MIGAILNINIIIFKPHLKKSVTPKIVEKIYYEI